MNRYSESQTKSAYRSPVYNVRAVPVEKVVANSYNPNVVAPPEMKLLELSIWEDGYTMPCVCYYDAERDRYELVDGYHRYLVLKTSKRIYERERGLLPVAVIEKDLSNRMASTIRHNRARGTHNVGYPFQKPFIKSIILKFGKFIRAQTMPKRRAVRKNLRGPGLRAAGRKRTVPSE